MLLTIVATVGSAASVLEIGPIWELGSRYGLPPEITAGVLQLFLLDCGLILLPLSVMVTQQRMWADLMTNAVKFTPDGGTVEVTLRSDGEMSEIVVKDDGMGMTEEHQSKLLTRFFRSTSSFDQAVRGTGLGLTIVQAIVAMHGGKIGVSSAYGQGTTVTVTIPRVALAATAPATAAVSDECATG